MKDKINEVIRSVLNVEDEFELTRNTHLFDDLGACELDLFAIALELEDVLDCNILDEEIERWSRVGSIYRQFGITETPASAKLIEEENND